MQEVLHAVAHLGLVTTAGRSIARSYPVPDIGFAAVDDLSPVVLAVAVRAGDARPLVAEFVALAREVVARQAVETPDIAVLSPV